MTIRAELLALKDKNGLIVPERAIAWAKKNRNSKLHGALEWDDSKAGHAYRLWQIRHLVSIHVVTVEGRREVVSLSIDRPSPGGGYRALGDVLPRPDLREVLLSDALADLDRVQLKYEDLRELSKVWAEKDKVKHKAGRAKRSPAKPGAAESSRRRAA